MAEKPKMCAILGTVEVDNHEQNKICKVEITLQDYSISRN